MSSEEQWSFMREALMAQGVNDALGKIQNLMNQAKPETERTIE